jgi:hypothetical protein
MRRLAVLTGVCLLVWASAVDARGLETEFNTRSCSDFANDGGSYSLAALPSPADGEGLWATDWTAVATAVSPVNHPPTPLSASFSTPAGNQDSPRHRTATTEYSDAYLIRRRIHVWASVATLPLFAIEYKLGSDLYNNPEQGNRGAHAAVGSAIGVLFGVNTVTGVWNLWEGRKDPAGRARRIIHGVLMLASDAGFVATGALAPEHEEEQGGASFSNSSGRSTHRAVALTSMGIATVGYLMMLFH